MILAYIGKEINGETLVQIFKELKLEYRELFDEDFNSRIGALLKEGTKKKCDNSRKTFLLFSKVSESQMDLLKEKMHQNDIYIPRIALETEQNVHWTLKELLDAIDEEVEYFQLRDAIISKLKKPNMYRVKTDPNYIKNLNQIVERISSEDVTINELKEMKKYLFRI